RKRQVIKQVIAQVPQEYTEAQNDAPKEKKSFWSRLFAPNPKKPKADNALKISVIKPLRLPTRTKTAKEPAPKAAPMPEVKEAAAKKVEMTTASGGGEKGAGSGDDFGVNLLSGEYAQAFAQQNQTAFFAYAAGSAVALVVVVYLGLHLYQMQKAGQVERSQAANVELEGAINSFNDLDKEDKLLGRKVGVIKELLMAHISTRSFLEKLESVTIPEVTFLALAASQEGGVTVTARATSYTALARQLTVLQEDTPWVKEVSVAA
ncbi:MAG: hypothetical protein AAB779_00610, partial [Patescibacteria group bacterium]